VGGIGISRQKRAGWQDGRISNKKWAGKQDLRTLLWTLFFPFTRVIKIFVIRWIA